MMTLSYEIEIHGNWLKEGVDADIKYPCGEIVESWRCDTCVEAGKKVSVWLEQNKFVPHKDCHSDYCKEP